MSDHKKTFKGVDGKGCYQKGKKSSVNAQTRLEELQKRLKEKEEHKTRRRLSNSQTDSIVKGLLKPSEVFERTSRKKELESKSGGLLEGRRSFQDKAPSSRTLQKIQNNNLLEKRLKIKTNPLKPKSDVRASNELSNKNRSLRNDKTGIYIPDEKKLVKNLKNKKEMSLFQSSSKMLPCGNNSKKREILTETGKLNLYKRKVQEYNKVLTNNESEGNRFFQPSSMEFDIRNHLQSVRKFVEKVDSSEIKAEEMDWENSYFNPAQTVETKPRVLFVVDTNVFLSSLPLILEIKKTVIRGLNPLIVVAWQVLKELDYLKKESSSISKNARIAINHILKWISASDSSVASQSAQIANDDFPAFKVEVGDDHLIKCCLQLKISNPYVILLSNDKNLRVKCLVNQIPALPDSELTSLIKNDISLHTDKLHSLETWPGNNDAHMFKIFKLTQIFKDCISKIIGKCLRERYGDIWVLYAPRNPSSIREIIRTLEHISQSFPPEMTKKIAEYVKKIESLLNNHEQDFKITVYEGEKIGKAFYYLMKTMGFLFKSEAEDYDKQSAFYKSKDSEDNTESTYSLQCYNLTETHFDLFYSKISSFCCWLSYKSGIPFNYSCPVNSNFQDFKLEDIEHLQENIYLLGGALERIYQLPTENITVETKALKDIYSILVLYNGKNLYPDFSCEDVLEFSISPLFKERTPNGVNKLKEFYEYLSLIIKMCFK